MTSTIIIEAIKKYCAEECHRDYCHGCPFEAHGPKRNPPPANRVKDFIVRKLAQEWEENPRWPVWTALWRLLRPFLKAA